jgi:hypothetical protein
MKQGGFAVYRNLVNKNLFEDLLQETSRLYERAQENYEPVSDQELWRGGSPARRFLSVSGGNVQAAIYQAPEIRGILTDLCGLALRPTGSHGSFSYYARPGDYLAIHRDIEKCDLAVITCLHETHPEDVMGKLAVYPDRLFEPLSAIRATPKKGCLPQLLSAGHTILLFGGIVPHQMLPVAEGQIRFVSIL